ncbi:MAG: hypothetical protein ACLUES_16460 [Flavonifractor plautii]
MKDRTAGIELEAHRRAQAVQAEAEERIRKTRVEVEQWLNRVQGITAPALIWTAVSGPVES